MPQFVEYIKQHSAHMISLTATFVLAARQTLTYKHRFFSSPTVCSCCIYAICSMVFLVPVEKASDLPLQSQGTAITPHRCACYGGTKGI